MKFLAFYATRKFIAVFTTVCSSPHREPDYFSPPSAPSYFMIHFNIILPFTPRSLQVDSFPQISPPKPCMHLCSPTYVLHAPPISFFSIWSPEQYCVRSTDRDAPRHAFFSSFPLPRPSSVSITQEFVSFLTENTQHLHYKDQSVCSLETKSVRIT